MKNFILRSLLSVTLTVLITSSFITAQQKDKDMVLKQIETLFDGMRAGDSSAVASVFVKDATMQSISKDREGNTALSTGSISEFKKALGTPHAQVWDERVANIQINVDCS